MTRNEQNMDVSSTKRTTKDTGEQSVSSPPFDSAEYLLRTPPYLKQGYKLLEASLNSPLYSNCCRALEPIFRRCQRSSIVFPDNEQGLFTGLNRLLQENRELAVSFVICKPFHCRWEMIRCLRRVAFSATSQERDSVRFCPSR